MFSILLLMTPIAGEEPPRISNQSVIADASLGAMLRDLGEMTEIRDADGHVLGYFTPAENGGAADARRLLAALDKGRNTQPIGELSRESLHDREVLR